MLAIIQRLSHDLNSGIFAVNMCCIVLADLYLLYFIKAADEKKAYDMKVRALFPVYLVGIRGFKMPPICSASFFVSSVFPDALRNCPKITFHIVCLFLR